MTVTLESRVSFYAYQPKPISMDGPVRRRCARNAIDWVIDHLRWSEIAHCIDTDNTQSIAVAHRLGAKWLRVAPDGHGKETQVYGQTAEQYPSLW